MRLEKWTTPLIAGAASVISAAAIMAASTIPVLWTAGGLDAGTTSAGQSARMTVDALGNVAIVSGPVGIRSRFERRLAKTDWLRNDPNRATGGKNFTESYFATVAVLMAFAEVEKLVFESVRSPLPLAGANRIVADSFNAELSEFDRPGIQDADGAPRISGRLGA